MFDISPGRVQSGFYIVLCLVLLMLNSDDVVIIRVYNCAKPQQDSVGYSGSQ